MTYSQILITRHDDYGNNRITFEFEWKADEDNPNQCAITTSFKHYLPMFYEFSNDFGDFMQFGTFCLKIVERNESFLVCERKPSLFPP